MRKSLLNLYLQKVAEGDLEYIDRLCSQLADRLIYAPITTKIDAVSAAKTTFSVVKLTEVHRDLVPVFTSEEGLKKWMQSIQHTGGSISLLGADFCAALGDKTWLQVDPGSSLSVELQPKLVCKIAAIEASTEKFAEACSTIAVSSIEESNSAKNKPIKLEESKTGNTQELMKPLSITSTNIERPALSKTSQQDKPAPNSEQSKTAKKKSFLNFLKSK